MAIECDEKPYPTDFWLIKDQRPEIDLFQRSIMAPAAPDGSTPKDCASLGIPDRGLRKHVVDME
jgi:hypothetical protein